MTPPTATTAQWMADPKIQSKPVNQLVLPGTHDSGTFGLTYELSQIMFDNIKFLWQLSPDQAGTGGCPCPPCIYVGPDLYAFIFQLAMDVSRAQDQSILDQLNGGVRFFDLRVYWDTDKGELYIQHGLRSCPLAQVLQGVGAFVRQKGGKELVLLQVGATNFKQRPEGVEAILNQLEAYVGPSYLYTPDTFDGLAAAVLSSITGGGSQVVVMTPDDVTYPPHSPILSTRGYQTSGRGAGGVNDVAALAQAERAGLQQPRKSPLYEISWTLTPQVSDIVTEAESRVAGHPSQPVLKNLAITADAALQNFVDQNGKASFNLITVDWFEASPVVTIAIQRSSE